MRMKRVFRTCGINCAVLLLTLLLFTVFWEKDEGLAYSNVISSRFAFYRAMIIIGSCGLFVAWKAEGFRYNLLDRCVMAFAGYVFVNAFITGSFATYRMELFFLLAVLYFVFRLLTMLTKSSMKLILYVFIFAGIFESILGILQLHKIVIPNHSMFSVTGSFFNPGPYGGFLAIVSSIALYYSIGKRYHLVLMNFPCTFNVGMKYMEKISAWILMFFAVSLFPAIMSRAGLLAALAGWTVVLVLRYELVGRLYRLYVKHKEYVLPAIIAGAMILCGVFIALYLVKQDSADGRLLIWKVSLMALKENAWLGVGLGHFPGIYGRTQADYFSSGKASAQEAWLAGSPEYGFNEYLQLGIELGGIGLLLFLLVLFVAVRQVLRADAPERIPVLGGLVAFCVFAFFSYPLSILPLCVVFVLFLSMAGSLENQKITLPYKRIYARVALSAVCLIAVMFIIKDKRIEKMAYIDWKEEQRYYQMNIFEGTVDNYRRLYAELKDQPKFLFEFGQCLSKTGGYMESDMILERGALFSSDPMFYNIMGKNKQAMHEYDDAESCFMQAANMIPHRLYPYYLMAKMYIERGSIESALETARKLLSMQPKTESQAVEEMRGEMNDLIEKYN